MESLYIAHISDLHFGAPGQTKTWDALSEQLQQITRPDMVLVTGDIADSPRSDLFGEAKEALDTLCRGIDGKSGVEYFVCPGNHDRFPKGNAPFMSRKTGMIRRWMRQSAAEFNLCFQGRVPDLNGPIQRSLGPANNHWTIRLVGLDSSLNADASARGFITRVDINAVRQAMAKADDVDLGIMLVHHHLMPVRSLEARREGHWFDLTNLTPLVNAGSLVEALAAAHVDVALHGHEHAENWGRYATFETGGGETNVIGAGSATGTVTLKNCDLETASYNVLELREDRRVRLLVYRFDSTRGAWTTGGREFDIYDSQAMRRTRFMRRAGDNLVRVPNSDVSRYIEFTRERDGIIREVRTNIDFSRDPVLTIAPANSTGFPTDLNITLTNEDGAVWQPEDELVFQTGDRPGSFYFQCTIPEAVAKVPQRVEFSFRWFGGAMLTAEEPEATQPGRLDRLRGQGWEFAEIRVDTYYSLLRLVLKIPAEFAPPASDVAPYLLAPDSPDHGEALPQHDVASGLRVLGEGLYVLVIPYPRIGYEYGIKWKLPKAKSLTALNGKLNFQFATAARRKGNSLAQVFHDSLAGTPLASRSSIAIYLPSDEENHRLELAGRYPTDATVPSPIDVGNETSLVTQAWRGVSTVWIDPGETEQVPRWLDVGLMNGESALIALPIRFGVNWTNELPWGVLRIGLRELTDDLNSLMELENGQHLLARLMGPMIAMLAAAEVGQS